MPFKVWAPFERLLSDDMNTYVGQQAPAIFVDASARDTAITAPVLGQPAYLTGTRQLMRWNGSTWKTEGIAGGCAAILGATADQSLTSGTDTKITLPTVLEDTNGFALGGNALTIPAGLGGLYQLTGVIVWGSPGATVTGYRQHKIRKNNAADILLARYTGVASTITAVSLVGMKRLAAGDYVELFGIQTQGAAVVSGGTAEYGPLLQLVRVGD